LNTLIEAPLLASSARSSAKLPALAEHVDQLPCPPASAVVITHILDTAVPFIEAVSRAVDLEAVIGIPYSTMPTARGQLEAAGHRVVIPPDIESLPALARQEIERASVLREEPVIVQEIGGYCAPFVEELWEAGLIAGVVEDTKQGHWRYAERGSLPCPVLSIAESPLKALEDQQVGRSISHALETLLRRQFHRLLTETKVGILGYGGIGEATAAALSSLGARVAVYDRCGIRMAKAALDGFGDTSREELVRSSDVLLGVSGHRSIEDRDLAYLRPGGILASGSSKQIEIDLTALNHLAVEMSEPGLIQRFTLADEKHVFLLNEGMPINFLEQSILGRVLDLVYTELFLCMREIALGNVGPGLQSLDIDQHRMAAQKWHRLHWV
jgi:adenosylhomocysteinase